MDKLKTNNYRIMEKDYSFYIERKQTFPSRPFGLGTKTIWRQEGPSYQSLQIAENILTEILKFENSLTEAKYHYYN